jgi:carbamoyltransferase
MGGSVTLPTLGLYGIQDQGDFVGARWTHDHSMALIVDGRVEWVFELERYTRRKHDNKLPVVIEDLLPRLDLPSELRVVCADSFTGRAFVSRTGRWRLEGNHVVLGEAPPLQRGHGRIDFRTVETWYTFHELAHVASNLPFTGGFEDDSLLAHLDGGASQSNASVFHYRAGEIRHLHSSWETAPAVLNFGYNDLTHAMLGLDEERRMAGPGRLMGYAAFGRPRPELREWLTRHDWFRRHWREPEVFFRAAKRDLGRDVDPGLDLRDPLLMDIAACCQAELEDTMVDLLRRHAEATGARRLYLAGGVGLNIELNRKLVASGLFDAVHVPPCTSDCGLALGAAALHTFLERGAVEPASPFLQRIGWSPPESWGRPLDVPELADRLAAGQVVGLCVGAAEVGPRALGHRSLLAAPDTVERRRHVSETVKGREWYRPVAPVVLEERADEVFPGATATPLTRYMLCSLPVAPQWRERIPGVVHVDGSARAQVVRRDDPEQRLLVAILDEVWRRHGLPCLINTSFNGPGEPIVQTAGEALAAAARLGVDALVLEDRMEAWAPRELVRP